MRGENDSIMDLCLYDEGTSPRARGKLEDTASPQITAGNIPACAGKTTSWGVMLMLKKEHPRVRGENVTLQKPTLPDEGTSPRARGKQLAPRRCCQARRNIPACAGKT